MPPRTLLKDSYSGLCKATDDCPAKTDRAAACRRIEYVRMVQTHHGVAV
jgi:hypothetical protein